MDFFKDEKLNKIFEKQGYVVVKLFNNQQIKEILDFYYANIKHRQIELNQTVFHTTSNSSDANLIKKVNDFLRPHFVHSLNNVLKNHKVTIANYIIKESSNNETVGPHMDWSFVDENQFQSFGIWVALEDVGFKNGNMQVIPGSHRFFPSLRVSPKCPVYFENYIDRVKNFLIDVPTKAGECVIFRHNLIHSSRKNISGKERIACVTAGYQENAKLLHFYLDETNPDYEKIEVYKMNLDDFINLEHRKRPVNAFFLGYKSFQYAHLDYKKFEIMCKSNVRNVQVWKKRMIDVIYK
jgi:ectoine hydroxylase-related dioxygenase (phytanoyl-CoA dioxygenase family)